MKPFARRIDQDVADIGGGSERDRVAVGDGDRASRLDIDEAGPFVDPAGRKGPGMPSVFFIEIGQVATEPEIAATRHDSMPKQVAEFVVGRLVGLIVAARAEPAPGSGAVPAYPELSQDDVVVDGVEHRRNDVAGVAAIVVADEKEFFVGIFPGILVANTHSGVVVVIAVHDIVVIVVADLGKIKFDIDVLDLPQQLEGRQMRFGRICINNDIDLVYGCGTESGQGCDGEQRLQRTPQGVDGNIHFRCGCIGLAVHTSPVADSRRLSGAATAWTSTGSFCSYGCGVDGGRTAGNLLAMFESARAGRLLANGRFPPLGRGQAGDKIATQRKRGPGYKPEPLEISGGPSRTRTLNQRIKSP